MSTETYLSKEVAEKQVVSEGDMWTVLYHENFLWKNLSVHIMFQVLFYKTMLRAVCMNSRTVS